MALAWADSDIDLLLTGSLFLPNEMQPDAWRDHGAGVERSLNDIVDLVWLDLTRVLADKDQLRVMAAAGQRRFLSVHTWTHWARSLAQIGETLPATA